MLFITLHLVFEAAWITAKEPPTLKMLDHAFPVQLISPFWGFPSTPSESVSAASAGGLALVMRSRSSLFAVASQFCPENEK